MKILIACESSATVRDAFRRRGHDAWSCDILECEGDPRYHLQGDIRQFLNHDWDMMIAHPPCTFLCSSGLHWNTRVPGRAEKTEEALKFVWLFLDSPIPRIVIENPVGCISTKIRKYDQKIQPWMFGDDASKGTCLWLKGLCPLTPTKIVPPRDWAYYEPDEEIPEGWRSKKVDGFIFATPLPDGKPIWSNQTPSGQNKLGPSADRWKLRSKTYAGIAEAMATCWGK